MVQNLTLEETRLRTVVLRLYSAVTGRALEPDEEGKVVPYCCCPDEHLPALIETLEALCGERRFEGAAGELWNWTWVVDNMALSTPGLETDHGPHPIGELGLTRSTEGDWIAVAECAGAWQWVSNGIDGAPPFGALDGKFGYYAVHWPARGRSLVFHENSARWTVGPIPVPSRPPTVVRQDRPGKETVLRVTKALLGLFTSCEIHCVYGCCGLGALDLQERYVKTWFDRVGVPEARDAMEELRDAEYLSRPLESLVSKDLNAHLAGENFADLLRRWIDVLEPMLDAVSTP